MNHIGLVALKAQIMRFIVQSIVLQRYRRWDIFMNNVRFLAYVGIIYIKPRLSEKYLILLWSLIL